MLVTLAIVSMPLKAFRLIAIINTGRGASRGDTFALRAHARAYRCRNRDSNPIRPNAGAPVTFGIGIKKLAAFAPACSMVVL